MPPEMSAEDVLNYTLDRTGQGLDTGDFDLFSSVFAIPYRMSTFEGQCTLSSFDDIRAVFDKARDHRALIGATSLIRHILTAEYKTPTHVEAVHISHVMRGNIRIKEPYPVFSVIKWIDGAWKIVSGDYAIDPEDPQADVNINFKLSGPISTHAAPRQHQ